MSNLRLKVRKKIYTSDYNYNTIDTQNKGNMLVVLLGNDAIDNMESLIHGFLNDILKKQISGNKISFVKVNESNIDNVVKKVYEAVEQLEFLATCENKLYISFVTVMDDKIHEKVNKIDISAIENLKNDILGGYSVSTYYDFYGIFLSNANYTCRQNARKLILDFLDANNGNFNLRKRVYHQMCLGKDYYRTSKAISFLMLLGLIEKIDSHNVIDSTANNNNYTWTTFSFYEKNLVALVVYQIVSSLLKNQKEGIEYVSEAVLDSIINKMLLEQESEIKKLISLEDVNYIPFLVRKFERKLGFFEKLRKENPIEYRIVNEEESINSLICDQKKTVNDYISKNITNEYLETFIFNLIKECTSIESIDKGTGGLIYLCLKKALSNYKYKHDNVSYGGGGYLEYYNGQYSKMMLDARVQILESVVSYFEEHMPDFIRKVHEHWNNLNVDVTRLINEFEFFESYFNGIDHFTREKSVKLLSNYDEILDKINIQDVVNVIDNDSYVYENVLSSYFTTVKSAGEIVKTFGGRPIVPDLQNVIYCLYSNMGVNCPKDLDNIYDSEWFRKQEIAILFTAKNRMEDCDNLPYNI